MRPAIPKWRWQYVVTLWLLALLGLWLYLRGQGVSPAALLGTALDGLRGDPLAPLWLLLVYLVRPLLLLPITLLTVAAGMLFGAVWGGLYAAAGALVSSSLAYAFGRLFGGEGGGMMDASGPLQRLTERPFETVLLCRFLGVPGDLVNYAAGYLKVSFWAFAGATLIGGAPGSLAGTLAGASLTSVSGARLSLRWEFLLASAALLLVSLVVSWGVRRRTQRPAAGQPRGPAPD